MRSRLLAAAVAVPLVAVSLTGCGDSAAQKYAKTAPATIDKDARAAVGALKSVHIAGTITDSGSTVSIDLHLDNQGNCTGSITNAGQKIQLIGVTGGHIYVKAAASFWQSAAGVPAATAAVYGTKWVTGQSLASFGSICNLNQFAKNINASTIAADKPKVVGTGTVNGTDVVKLEVIDKDKSKSILSVAVNNPHNVIQVAGEKSKGAVTFSEFNVPVKSTAPSGSVSIDPQMGSH